MDIEYTLKRSKNCTLYLPKITFTCKKEVRQLKKLGKFLTTLEKSIFEYTESSSFPQGAKYYAECIFCGNDLSKMQIDLILKDRGRTIHKRSILYTWLKGRIASVEITDTR